MSGAWWGSNCYATAVHVVPATTSDDRMHIMDDTCWCRPIINTDMWEIQHQAGPTGGDR
jgi:hypothetical protein